ncbi:hypothetical protein F5884DRAFT_853702 [Xylogone sp. PMI_703]|nr:hypothetical protein F5884DRAFT_853702 [Xylogone sp. PMI_703]
MSSDSIAAFRKNYSSDLKKLADQHLQHDLRPSDRDTIKSAASKITTHTYVGTFLGLGLGIALAWKLRKNRMQLFQILRTAERPTHVVFADGRQEAIPDITPWLQPSALGDVAAYTFFSLGGMFLGGECGLLSGAAAGRRTIMSDPETRARIEKAYLNFRVDVLKKQIDVLQNSRAGLDGEEPIIW